MPAFVNTGSTRVRVADYGNRYVITEAHASIRDDLRDDFEFKPTNLRAVDQSPEPGTLLASGSTVIVYFEDQDGFSPDIYDGSHSGYSGMKAKDIIEKVNGNAEVKKIVKAGKEYEELTTAEKITMDKFFSEELGLEIDKTDRTKNSKAAYDALIAAYVVIEGPTRGLFK